MRRIGTGRIGVGLGAAIAGISLALTPTLLGISLPQAQATETTCNNIALHKPVTASGRESAESFGPELAVDGNLGPNDKIKPPVHNEPSASRWSANNSDDAWISVDFQGVATISAVNLYWGNTYGHPYRLLGSMDGEQWHEMSAPENGAKAAMTSPTLTNTAPVRHLKMQISGKSQRWALSLWELQVCGSVVPDPVSDTVNLVPKPVFARLTDEAPFTLTPETVIETATGGEAAAQLLATTLRQATGFALPIQAAKERTDLSTSSTPAPPDTSEPAPRAGTTPPNVIRYSVAPQNPAVAAVADEQQNEAYTLEISPHKVEITARTPQGAIWGTQSLLQLFGPWAQAKTPVARDWSVAALRIEDGPRYSWRSLLLDPVRSFYTVSEVETLLDQMSRYKLNTFQLHLNDDQGWRLEIPARASDPADDIDYAQLIARSAVTSYMAGKSQFAPPAGRTGYYSLTDYAHIVHYAAQRGIQVVPEFDGPGHAASQLHAIAQLNSAKSNPKPAPGQDRPAPFDESTYAQTGMDVTNPATLRFVKHVVESISQLMGDVKYMHVGGDESHTTTGRDYINYMNHVIGELGKHGKQPIVWNEALAHQEILPASGLVQWWVGNPREANNNLGRGLQSFVQRGGKVIASPAAHTYYPQRESTAVAGPSWACGQGCTLKVAYDWNPSSFLGVPEKSVLGVGGAVWSEHLRTANDMQFLVFPRLLAHAEVGWTPQRLRSFRDFTARVAREGNALNMQGVTFHFGKLVNWTSTLALADHSGERALVVDAPAEKQSEATAMRGAETGTASDGATVPAVSDGETETPVAATSSAGNMESADQAEKTGQAGKADEAAQETPTAPQRTVLGYLSAPGQNLENVHVSAILHTANGEETELPVEKHQAVAFHFTDEGRTTGRQMGSIIEIVTSAALAPGEYTLTLRADSGLPGENEASGPLKVARKAQPPAETEPAETSETEAEAPGSGDGTGTEEPGASEAGQPEAPLAGAQGGTANDKPGATTDTEPGQAAGEQSTPGETTGEQPGAQPEGEASTTTGGTGALPSAPETIGEDHTTVGTGDTGADNPNPEHGTAAPESANGSDSTKPETTAPTSGPSPAETSPTGTNATPNQPGTTTPVAPPTTPQAPTIGTEKTEPATGNQGPSGTTDTPTNRPATAPTEHAPSGSTPPANPAAGSATNPAAPASSGQDASVQTGSEETKVPLLEAPVNSRLTLTSTRNGTTETQVDTAVRGETLTLTASGFQPSERVTFYLHSQVITLGHALANTQGIATLVAAIPTAAELGDHTLIVRGEHTPGVAKLPISLVENPTATPENQENKSATPRALAKTGTPGTNWIAFSALLLALGLGTLTVRRKTRA